MEKWDFSKINTRCSLHNHSNFSDGASSLADMVRAGKAAGLEILGISDHWVVPPFEGSDSEEWSMDLSRLDEYVDTLLKLKKEYESDSFVLKIGLEVDFFFENVHDVVKNLQTYPLDYMIGSVHYSGNFSVDHDSSDWLPLSEEERHEVTLEYWRKLEGAANCGLFTFIGHLDLPKKFAMIDNSRYLPQAVKVLDAVQKTSGCIELNTAGWYKPAGEPYPGKEMLQEAYRRNAAVTINADAHCPEHLTRGFSEAAALLKQVGYC